MGAPWIWRLTKSLHDRGWHRTAFMVGDLAVEFPFLRGGLTESAVVAHRRLGLAAWLDGRQTEALRHAEAAVAFGIPEHSRRAHVLAVLACNALHDFERAEAHARATLELARRDRKAGSVSRATVQLLGAWLALGRLDDATRGLAEFDLGDPHDARVTLMLRVELLALQGRFDEAIDTHETARAQAIGSGDERWAWAWHLIHARLEAPAGRFASALANLESIARSPSLRHDLARRALCTWVLAALGREADSRDEITVVERDVGTVVDDPSVLASVRLGLARARAALGDHAASVVEWQRYLATHPAPMLRPAAHKGLGDSLLALGDVAGAREAFEKAVALGIDTDAARLAKSRLDALPPC